MAMGNWRRSSATGLHSIQHGQHQFASFAYRSRGCAVSGCANGSASRACRNLPATTAKTAKNARYRNGRTENRPRPGCLFSSSMSLPCLPHRRARLLHWSCRRRVPEIPHDGTTSSSINIALLAERPRIRLLCSTGQPFRIEEPQAIRF